MLNYNLAKAEINSIVLNLSINCPIYCPNFGKTKKCILSKAQNFSLSEKTKWLENLTENQKLLIVLKHEKCYAKDQKIINAYL